LEKNKISVIVCIYNVSQYVDRCIESIVNQTYKNLEIILVCGQDPSGRDDGCMSVCRRYASRDKRIKIVECVAAGISDARNRGLAAVTGDLIGFVDGDDYIDREMYTSLHQMIVKHKSQIAVCGRYYEYRNGTLQDTPNEKEPQVMSGEEALEMVLSGTGFYLHCWDKLFRAEMWKDVEFPVDKFVEDRVVVDKLLGKAKKVVYDSTPRYHFRERMGSLSKSKGMAKHNAIANQDMAQFIYDKHVALAPLCDKYLIYEYITAIQNVYISGNIDKEELAVYREELTKLSAKIHINPYVDWKLQAKLILAFFAPGLLAGNTKRKNKKNPMLRFN